MNYADPRLRDMLAGEYVMATLPRRARARFERLMAADPALARLVGEWQERLMPLDATADPVAPPPQIWRAIESATGAAVVAAARPERRGGRGRGAAGGRGAARGGPRNRRGAARRLANRCADRAGRLSGQDPADRALAARPDPEPGPYGRIKKSGNGAASKSSTPA